MGAQENWILLTKTPDLVVRGALVSRLGAQQIEVMAPDRDMIVNWSSTPNLSLEGYSAIFDGYPVFVRRQDLAEAQNILRNFEEENVQVNSEKREVDHARGFYFSALMSLLLPGLMHVIALYHLGMTFQKKQKWSVLRMGASFLLLTMTAYGVFHFGYKLLSEFSF